MSCALGSSWLCAVTQPVSLTQLGATQCLLVQTGPSTPHLRTSLAVCLKRFNRAIKTNNVHFSLFSPTSESKGVEMIEGWYKLKKGGKPDKSEQVDSKTKHKSAPRKR